MKLDSSIDTIMPYLLMAGRVGSKDYFLFSLTIILWRGGIDSDPTNSANRQLVSHSLNPFTAEVHLSINLHLFT